MDGAPHPDGRTPRLYRHAPQAAVRSLTAFRRAHPPRHLLLGEAVWDYVCLGEGGPTLLLLHGMAGTYDIWWQQMLALQDRFQLVSLTYPEADGLEGYRRGIDAVLELAGVDRCSVIGSSLGGYLAQYLATREPERIQRLVLANTLPPNPILTRRTRGADRLIPLVPRWLLQAGMRATTRLMIYPASGRSRLLKAVLDEGTDLHMERARFLARYRALVEWFDPPDLAVLGIPTLILESANDPLISPTLQRMLRQTYPSARVHRFGAVGHFPYVNAPDLYQAALLEFLLAPA